MKIESFLKDVGGASRVTSARREKFRKGSPLPEPEDPIRALSDALHPDRMRFIVTDVRDVSPTSKTWRLRSTDGHIPIFQSGQYVNFRLQIGESLLSRPYTICSAPYEARTDKPFFEVTIRRNVPFVAMGVITVLYLVVWYQEWMLAGLVTLSFACYMGVVLYARDKPMMGMLMIPKTICYICVIAIMLGRL